MAKFLISTMPSVGHINGALPIVRKLVERGHDVLWYTGAEFRAKVEASGARFTPFKLATGFPESSNLTGLAAIKHDIKHVFVDSAPGQVQDIDEILQTFPADVILADMTATGAGWLHEKGEGPVWAAYGHLPLTLSSRDAAPFGLKILPDASFKGRLRNRILNWLLKKVIFRDVIAYTNQVRNRLGLPSQPTSPTDTAVSPYLYIQGTVAEFEYPRSDLPAQVHFVGPFLPSAPDNFVPPSWWPELKAGRPVVHVTQGTVATEADNLITPTIQALANEDVLLIVTTGGQPIDSLKLGQLPDNVRVEEFIPHYCLLPFVDVMVTNGGYNGVQVALANGVPLVGAGNTEDKPEVCNRISWAGAGINLKTHQPSSEQIRRAVKKILAEPSYRQAARRLQAVMLQSDAPLQSAQLLEQLAATKQPVTRLTAIPATAGVA